MENLRDNEKFVNIRDNRGDFLRGTLFGEDLGKLYTQWKNDVNLGGNRQELLKDYTDCLSILVFLRRPFLKLFLLSLDSSFIIASFPLYAILLSSSSIFSYFLYSLKCCWYARILLRPFTVRFPCVITSAPRGPALTSLSWALGLIFTSLLPTTIWMCFRHLGLNMSKQNCSFSSTLFFLGSHLFNYICIPLVILETSESF